MMVWSVINLTLPGYVFGGAIPPALLKLEGELYSILAWNETMTDAGWELHLSLMKPDDAEAQSLAARAHAASVMREALNQTNRFRKS